MARKSKSVSSGILNVPACPRHPREGQEHTFVSALQARKGSTGKACVLFDKKTMRYLTIGRNREVQ